MRHRFNSDNPVALGGFALIETFGLLVKTNREVGRFNKRPSQILKDRVRSYNHFIGWSAPYINKQIDDQLLFCF